MGIQHVDKHEQGALQVAIDAAHSLLRENNFEGAKEAFYKIINQNTPNNVINRTDAEKAINKTFLKIVNNNKEPPKKPFLTGMLKSVYLGYATACCELSSSHKNETLLAELDKTKKSLESIPSEKEDAPRVHLAWGRYYQATSQYKEADKRFDSAISLAKTNNNNAALSDIYFAKAYCYQICKQYDDAHVHYETAYKYKKNPFILLSHAICLEAEKQAEAALAKLEDGLKTHNDHIELRFGRARTLQTLHRYPEALEIFATLPKSKKNQLAAAFCWRDAGNYANALKILDSLSDANNPAYLELKGECLIQSDQLDRGIGFFEAAIKLNPNNPTSVINYALALEAVDKLELAEAVYKNHYEKFKDNKEFVLSYARYLELCGHFDLAIKIIELLPAEQQKDLTVVFTLTTLLAKNGQTDKSLKTLNTTSETKVTRLRKAFLFQNSDRLEEALELFDNLVNTFDQEADNKSETYKLALFGRARCLQLTGKLDKAIEDYKKLIAIDKFDENKWLSYARCSDEIYDFDGTIKIYQQAQQLFPDNINLILSNVITLQNRGDFVAAFTLLQTALQQTDTQLRELSNPNTCVRKNNRLLKLLLASARCATEAGNPQLAEHYYQKLFTYDPKNKLGRLGHIRLLEEQNAFSQADDECTQLLLIHPNDASLWLAKARILQKLKKFGEAEAILTDPQKTSKDDVEIKHALAHCWELQKNPETKELFAELSETYPHLSKVQLSYVVFLSKHGDNYKANSKFLELIKTFPYFIPARLKYAEFLTETHSYDNAVIQYERILKIFPYCTKAYLGLAQCYVARGNPNKAITLLEEQKEKLKYDWNYYYDLTDYYLKTNNHDKAVALYKTAKVQFPSHRKLLTSLEKRLDLVPAVHAETPLIQLANSSKKTIDDILTIARKISKQLQPYEIRVCGSCARNDFSSDIDITTCAPANIISAAIADLPNVTVREVKNDYLTKQGIYLFKTVIDGVSIDIRTRNLDKINITTFDDTQEMKKADFTINERFLTLDGRVIASKQSEIDLAAGVIRPTGDLSEIEKDPIRILKAFTLIAQTNFKLEPRFAAYIKTNFKFINTLPSILISKRLDKMLKQSFAHAAIQNLKDSELLQEQTTIAALLQQKQAPETYVHVDPIPGSPPHSFTFSHS